MYGPSINRTTIDKAVAATQKLYGGIDHYNATKIVFVNGSHDPWHALSLYTNNTDPHGVTSILIPRTAHCEDMFDSYPTDSKELIAARNRIEELIGIWLNDA